MDLNTAIGSAAGAGYSYKTNGNSTQNKVTYGNASKFLSNKNSFAVNYPGVGILTGHGRCTSQTGTGIWNGAAMPDDVSTADTITDQTGTSTAKSCWCHVEGFFPTNGPSAQLTSQWVFRHTETSSSNCTSNCAQYCGMSLYESGANHRLFRTAVFDSVDTTCDDNKCGTGYSVGSGNSIPAGVLTATGPAISNIKNDGTTNGDTTSMGITENNSFAVNFGANGIITGFGRCSSQFGYTDGAANNYEWTNPTRFDVLLDETGVSGARNCYCRLDSYTPSGGTKQKLSGTWIYRVGTDDCASSCAFQCATRFKEGTNYTAFRTALVNNANSCVRDAQSNVYNITWQDALDEDVAANNAATATYGGDINTPVRVNPAVFQTTQKGKRFIGWTFGAPIQE